MSESAERVARGAALLDERVPDWWQRIDVDTLRLADECHCVLGQLAPAVVSKRRLAAASSPFDAARKALGLQTWDDAEGRGFDVWGRNMGAKYGALTKEWRRVIAERRDA